MRATAETPDSNAARVASVTVIPAACSSPGDLKRITVPGATLELGRSEPSAGAFSASSG